MSGWHGLTFCIAAHGSTADRGEGRLTGRGDSPLDAWGARQAHANGYDLLHDPPVDIGGFEFISSPLSRARAAMEIILDAAKRDRMAYRVDDRLTEIDIGEWQGRTFVELETSFPEALAARARNPWHWRWPGGESLAQYHARVANLFDTLTRDTFVLCHPIARAMFRTHYLGLPPEQEGLRSDGPPGILVLRNGECETFSD